MKEEISSITRSAGYVFVRLMASGVAQLGITIVIARVYGASGNGQYSVSLLIPTIFAALANMGIGPSNVYHIASSKVSVRTAQNVSLVYFLVLSLIGVSFGGGLIAILGGEAFPGVPKGMLYTSLILMPSLLFIAYSSSILQGLSEFKWLNLVSLVHPMVAFCTITVMVFLFGSSLHAVLFAYCGTSLVSVVVFIFIMGRVRGGNSHGNALEFKGYIKSSFIYGWKSHFANIVTLLNYRFDLLMVNFFLGAEKAGFYSIAVQIAERVWLVAQSFGTILFPRLSGSPRSTVGRGKAVGYFTKLVGGITALCLVLLALIGGPLITLIFGDSYLVSYYVVLFLIPGILVGSVTKVLASEIAASGFPEYNLYSVSLGLVSNVILNVFLIGALGVYGASLATSFSYFLIMILVFIYYRRMS